MKSLVVFVIFILQIINSVPVRNTEDFVMDTDSYSELEDSDISQTRDQVGNVTPVSSRSAEYEEYLKKTPMQRSNIPSLHVIPSEFDKNLEIDDLKPGRQPEDVKQKYVEFVKKFSSENKFPNVEPYAAFSGDNCATGYMRFGEICVDGDA